MNNKERIENIEAWMQHCVRERIALGNRVDELETILSLKEPLAVLDDVIAENHPAPKPIDWSRVADCVPVKLWDDGEEDEAFYVYLRMGHIFHKSDWNHASLITGIDIAWHGGERRTRKVFK